MSMSDMEVSFSVKELFLEIRNDLRDLNTHVNTIDQRGSDQAKASMEKIEDLSRRVMSLEMHTASTEAVEQSRKQIFKLTVATIVAIAGMIVNVVVAVWHH